MANHRLFNNPPDNIFAGNRGVVPLDEAARHLYFNQTESSNTQWSSEHSANNSSTMPRESHSADSCWGFGENPYPGEQSQRSHFFESNDIWDTPSSRQSGPVFSSETLAAQQRQVKTWVTDYFLHERDKIRQRSHPDKQITPKIKAEIAQILNKQELIQKHKNASDQIFQKLRALAKQCETQADMYKNFQEELQSLKSQISIDEGTSPENAQLNEATGNFGTFYDRLESTLRNHAMSPDNFRKQAVQAQATLDENYLALIEATRALQKLLPPGSETGKMFLEHMKLVIDKTFEYYQSIERVITDYRQRHYDLENLLTQARELFKNETMRRIARDQPPPYSQLDILGSSSHPVTSLISTQQQAVPSSLHPGVASSALRNTEHPSALPRTNGRNSPGA